MSSHPAHTPNVKQLQFDRWVSVPISQIKQGDFLVYDLNVLIANKPVTFNQGRWHLNATRLEHWQGLIIDAMGSPGREFVAQAACDAFCYCVAFDNGTQMLMDSWGGIYSPRLPCEKLNAYCELNKDKFSQWAKVQEDKQLGKTS